MDARCNICEQTLCRSWKTCSRGVECGYHHPQNHSIEEVLDVAFKQIEAIEKSSVSDDKNKCCRLLKKLIKFLDPFVHIKEGLQTISKELEKVFDLLEATDKWAWALQLKFELAKATNSEYDPEPYHQYLIEKLERTSGEQDNKQRSFALMDMIEYKRIHEPENQDEAWRLAEEKLEFEVETNDLMGQGITLDLMLSLLRDHLKSSTEQAWNILERKLAVELRRENIRGQIKTLKSMRRWLTLNDLRYTQRDWGVLVQCLEVYGKNKQHKAISFTIKEMLRYKTTNMLENSDEAYDLIKKGYKLNLDAKDGPGQSFFLGRWIEWVKRYDEDNSENLQELLEKKMSIDRENKNNVGLSKTLTQMIHWIRKYDPTNIDYEWNLIQEKWEVDHSENLNYGQRISLQFKITWLQKNKPSDQETIRKFMEDKLKLSQNAGDVKSVHINSMALVKWYQMNAPDSPKELRAYLELALETSNELENKRYRAIALGSLRDWIQNNNAGAIDQIRELMNEELEIHKQREDYGSQSVVSQQIINWLERYEPDNLDERWEMISMQLELGQKIALMEEGQNNNMRISLRAAARFNIEFPNYESFSINPKLLNFPSNDPYEILYHISTLVLLGRGEKIRDFEVDFTKNDYVHSIIKQMLSFYDSDINRSKNPMEDCFTLWIQDLDLFTYDHEVHTYGIRMLKELETPLILDGPNVFNALQSSQHSIDQLISWLNATETPKIIHLSLNSLRDFEEQINEVHQRTKSSFSSSIISFLPEDAGMFAIAKITGGTIVTNDLFRKEKVMFSQSLDKEIFERTLSFKFTDNGFICSNNAEISS